MKACRKAIAFLNLRDIMDGGITPPDTEIQYKAKQIIILLFVHKHR